MIPAFVARARFHAVGLYGPRGGCIAEREGTERLRITPSPVHTDGAVDRLVSALSEIWSICALTRVAEAA